MSFDSMYRCALLCSAHRVYKRVSDYWELELGATMWMLGINSRSEQWQSVLLTDSHPFSLFLTFIANSNILSYEYWYLAKLGISVWHIHGEGNLSGHKTTLFGITNSCLLTKSWEPLGLAVILQIGPPKASRAYFMFSACRSYSRISPLSPALKSRCPSAQHRASVARDSWPGKN